MINLATCSEIIRRVAELERMEGNCGRAFRRFLNQMFSGEGKKLLSVEFNGYEDKELSRLEYAHLCAYLDSRSQHASQELVAKQSAIRFSHNVCDKTFNIVGAALELVDVDIVTAPVATLRRVVADIRDIVYYYFEHYCPEVVDAFAAEHDLLLSPEEVDALGVCLAGWEVALTPRAAELLKYFELPKRSAGSYLNEALRKAA